MAFDHCSPHHEERASTVLASIQYSSVDAAMKLVQRLGPSCGLAKVDLRNVYQVVPVHPPDWPLLGTSWRGHIFLETALPFGLRSAPKIFSAVDALLWAVSCNGIQHPLHFLDDFLLAGARAYSSARKQFQSLSTFVLSLEFQWPWTRRVRQGQSPHWGFCLTCKLCNDAFLLTSTIASLRSIHAKIA